MASSWAKLLHTLYDRPYYNFENKLISKFSQYFFYIKKYYFSVFQYSQVVQNTDSYKRLVWQQYVSNTNCKYIFGEIIEIPTNTYQRHHLVINSF